MVGRSTKNSKGKAVTAEDLKKQIEEATAALNALKGDENEHNEDNDETTSETPKSGEYCY